MALHQFGMGVADINRVAAWMNAAVAAAQCDPMNRLVILAGDFNYDAPEEAPWRSVGGRGVHRSGPASLRAVTARMTELQQQHPMRCELAHGVVFSRIDRVYVSIPGWLLAAMTTRVWTHSDPVALHKKGISDHSPVIAQVQPRARIARDARRLPSWVARTVEYAQGLRAFEAAASLGEMVVWARLELQKDVIRTAAQRALRAIDDEGGAEGVAPAKEDRAVIALARAVAASDQALVSRLRS